jgi:hypothetical protein
MRKSKQSHVERMTEAGHQTQILALAQIPEGRAVLGQMRIAQARTAGGRRALGGGGRHFEEVE